MCRFTLGLVGHANCTEFFRRALWPIALLRVLARGFDGLACLPLADDVLNTHCDYAGPNSGYGRRRGSSSPSATCRE